LAANPWFNRSHDARNVEYFEEQVQNMLSDIFAEDEWSNMATSIQTWCKLPKSMTTKQGSLCLFSSFNYDFLAAASS
jgi:hypothetical protein